MTNITSGKKASIIIHQECKEITKDLEKKMKYIPYFIALMGAIILINDIFDLYTANKWMSILGYLLMFAAILMLKFCPCQRKEDVLE